MMRTLFALTARELMLGLALSAAIVAPVAAQPTGPDQQQGQPVPIEPSQAPVQQQGQPIQPGGPQQPAPGQPQPPPYQKQYKQQGYQQPYQKPGYQPPHQPPGYQQAQPQPGYQPQPPPHQQYQQPYHEAGYRKDCYWTGSGWGYNSHGKVLVCRPHRPQGHGWVWHAEGKHHGWYHPQRRQWHYRGFHH